MKKVHVYGWLLVAFLGVLGAPAVRGEDVSITSYSPESGTFKATLEALTNDIDHFMSVSNFYKVLIKDSFAYAGIDSRGLNLGYARNIGSLYIGVCYGGSLIDDLYRRLTNQASENVLKRDIEITTQTEDGEKQNTTHDLVNMTGDEVPGTVTSKNDISVLLGFGNYGLKLGFSQYLQGTYNPLYKMSEELIVNHPFSYQDSPLEGPASASSPILVRNIRIDQEFINGLRPSLEFGGRIAAGSILVKPVLRVGIDFHQYSITQTGSSSIFDDVEPDKLTHIIDTEEGYLGDYMEPAVGLSLNFDFSSDPQIQSELGIDYDLFFRLYSNNSLPKTVKRKETKVIYTSEAKLSEKEIIDTETEITDMRMSIVPAFRFSAPLGDRMTVGLNLGVKIDLKTYETTTVQKKTIGEPEDPVSTTENMKQLIVLPKLGLGLSFKLIPNRFAINVGAGINILKYEKTETVEDDPTTPEGETGTMTTVSSTLTMPSTNLGAGLSFQFNEHLAGDVLVITSGLGAAVQKPAQFNLLLTMKY
ncbi:MAG: hypothetical protein LBL76_00595 [Treponema sp.]|nr:hypothetical protein [Treponema sp.]